LRTKQNLVSIINNKIDIYVFASNHSNDSEICEDNKDIKHFYQCKARNGSKEYWTIGDLNSRGVLNKLKFQLDNNPSSTFNFISAVGIVSLNDICISARNSNDYSEDFYKYQVVNQGSPRTGLYNKFCLALSIDHNTAKGRALAFDYLKRSYFIRFDEYEGNDINISRIGIEFIGDPSSILGNLVKLIEDNIRKKVTISIIYNYLKERGINSKLKNFDDRIFVAINTLKDNFKNSLNCQLINDKLIKRPETVELTNHFKNSDSIIAIHGNAGVGKSIVLYEFISYLETADCEYIPIRLDRLETGNNSFEFGEKLNLKMSPSFCLKELCGLNKQGVIIIDQLDSLKWASSQALTSLGVCKELIKEISILNAEGYQLSIVFACRSFELEHEPGIKEIFEDYKKNQNINRKLSVIKLKIDLLKDSDVKSILESNDYNWNNFSKKLLQIIRIPQNLYMFVNIPNTTHLSIYDSYAKLCRAFWNSKIKAITTTSGISEQELKNVIDIIIEFIENNSKIYCPARRVTNYPKTISELKSNGIIREDNSKLIFTHQTYSDFLVAEKINEGIDDDINYLFKWLGSKEEQVLSKREQLKLSLLLTFDEDKALFAKNIEGILQSSDIRFYLKHLALEILNQVEQPESAITKVFMNFIKDNYWQNHVLETAVLGNAGFIKILSDSNLLMKWLISNNTKNINNSLMILRNSALLVPEVFDTNLKPFFNKSDAWNLKILDCLPWETHKETDLIFDFRVDLAKLGYYKNIFTMKDLAKVKPKGTIEYLAIIFSVKNKEEIKVNTSRKFDDWNSDDSIIFYQISSEFYELTWNSFIDSINVATKDLSIFDLYSFENKWFLFQSDLHKSDSPMEHNIITMCIKAGRAYARKQPAIFLKQIEKLRKSKSLIIKQMILETVVAFPKEKVYSDFSIRYLLSSNDLLTLCSSRNKHKWTYSRKVIRAHSHTCSDELFKKLENVILNYHDNNELRMAKIVLKHWRDGYFGEYWGETQYMLLRVLPNKRISSKTFDLINVLKRKFDRYPAWHFVGHSGISGGWVVSPVHDKIEELSDNAWLKIINNTKKTSKKGSRFRQINTKTVAESNIRAFSSDFKRIAEYYPERFGRLALKFNTETNVAYINAVLNAMQKDKPIKEWPDRIKQHWKQCPIDIVEKFIDKFLLLDNRESAKYFCWMVRDRVSEDWSSSTLNKIAYFAENHPDPENNSLNVHCDKVADEVGIEVIFQNTLNCVRSIAAITIGEILYDKPELYTFFKHAIESLSNDSHPTVKMALVQVILPLLNIDKDYAVNIFCRISENDLRIPASPYSIHVFNNAILSHKDKLFPIIKNMYLSMNEEISKEGAQEIAGRWLLYGIFENDFYQCNNGTLSQKLGIVKVASELFFDYKYHEKSKEILQSFLNDENQEIREVISSIFGSEEIFKLSNIKQFIIEYIESKTFLVRHNMFIYSLEKYAGNLLDLSDLILSMFDRYCSMENTKLQNHEIYYEINHLIPILLRLYEQAKADNRGNIVNSALDIWDKLFEQRIGIVRDLTKAVENY